MECNQTNKGLNLIELEISIEKYYLNTTSIVKITLNAWFFEKHWQEMLRFLFQYFSKIDIGKISPTVFGSLGELMCLEYPSKNITLTIQAWSS